MRLKHAISVFGIVMVAASIAAAQAPAGGQPPPGGPAPAGGGQRAGGAPQPAPTNLQVMPKDTPRNVVVMRMQAITQALGVTCAYCHVFEGNGNPANDFATDVKPPKLVARVMMTMTGEINQKLAANIQKPADQLTAVGCMTCHRGEAIPKVPPPAARGAAPAGASPAGAPPAGAPPAGPPPAGTPPAPVPPGR
jgi:hypothetical protein